VSGRRRGRCCKHGRYKPSCHMRRHGQTRHVFFSFLHSRYPGRTQPRSQQPKKTSASCTPFYSRSVPLLNAEMMRIECSRNNNKNKRKKRKTNSDGGGGRRCLMSLQQKRQQQQGQQMRKKVKESERKKWQQRHKARQALGCS
jgi:hypothetical protein